MNHDSGFLCRLCGTLISEQMKDPTGQGGVWWQTPNPPICPKCGKDNSAEFKEAIIDFVTNK